MLNEEKYREATRKRDWRLVCELNGLNLDTFGTKKELLALGSFLEDGEVVYGFASGVISQTGTSNFSDFGMNTWLVALTSERFLFVDSALLSNSTDTQSVRLNRVQAVSASQGWVLGKIMVDIGSRTLVIDNCQKAHVKVIAELANKLLREQEEKLTAMPVAPSHAENKESPSSKLDMLERLGALKASGVLSSEEFDEAKRKILASM